MKTKNVVYCLGFFAVALIIGGFLVPPMGVIDGSVLTGVGEIIGIITLFIAMHAIDEGFSTKFTHGNTTIETTPDKDNE